MDDDGRTGEVESEITNTEGNILFSCLADGVIESIFISCIIYLLLKILKQI